MHERETEYPIHQHRHNGVMWPFHSNQTFYKSLSPLSSISAFKIALWSKEELILTHIGVKYDDSSSKKGRKEALNVLIKVPNISPTCTREKKNGQNKKQRYQWTIYIILILKDGILSD